MLSTTWRSYGDTGLGDVTSRDAYPSHAVQKWSSRYQHRHSPRDLADQTQPLPRLSYQINVNVNACWTSNIIITLTTTAQTMMPTTRILCYAAGYQMKQLLWSIYCCLVFFAAVISLRSMAKLLYIIIITIIIMHNHCTETIQTWLDAYITTLANGKNGLSDQLQTSMYSLAKCWWSKIICKTGPVKCKFWF